MVGGETQKDRQISRGDKESGCIERCTYVMVTGVIYLELDIYLTQTHMKVGRDTQQQLVYIDRQTYVMVGGDTFLGPDKII